MTWPRLPIGTLIERLEPPKGRVRMVLDTDTYNEVDDQFALCYAYLSPEKLDLQAVYAAPFTNDRSTGPEDGMEKSYREILRLLDKLGKAPEGFAFEGSRSYLPAPEAPVESPAARDLVAKAMALPEGEVLYVAAIGAITNVASALLMEPRLVEKIVLVWLGGQPLWCASAAEFNLMQDVYAARVVFDSGVPLVLLPTTGVTSQLQTTVYELRACIGGKNELCDTLLELFSSYSEVHFAWAKVIWDIAAVGYLLDARDTPSVLEPSPILSDGLRWSRDASRHPIRVAQYVHRDPIYRDLFTKLAAFRREDARA